MTISLCLKLCLLFVVCSTVFFDAPHKVGVEQGGGEDNNQCLGWWFSREDDYYKAIEYSDIEKGFSESVAHVIQFIEEQVHVFC